MNFDAADLRIARICADEAIQARGRRGRPIPPAMRRHRDRLTLAISTMSGVGPEFDSDPAQLEQQDELLTAKEAATIMHRTPRHATRLAKAGVLDAEKIGAQYLFKRSAVESYANERQTR